MAQTSCQIERQVEEPGLQLGSNGGRKLGHDLVDRLG
jgi:hypothetical protein